MRPSPLQSRFAVRFTNPLTTCPHAALVATGCACAIIGNEGIARPPIAISDRIVATMYDTIVRFIQKTLADILYMRDSNMY
jgi:hypothetical protein